MPPTHGTPSSYADLNELRAAVLRTALVLTRNRADAEDLVQIAFLRALDRAGSFDPDTNWPAWLKTVVRHLAIDLARRNRRWRFTELLDPIEPGATAVEPTATEAWTAITPEQLEAAVESIDAHYQAVYRLHHVLGASYAQMAEQLGIPVRTVGTRLHRARGRIRDTLRKTMAAEQSSAA
jgi:RNA polymerase sigma-70 factor (ECF subfamily)